MATFTVNTTADVVDGNYSQLSLREAVNRANLTTAADTIVFSGAVEGQTLVLTGGELVLNQDTTVDGDQNNDGGRVSLDGNGSSAHDVGSRHLSLEGSNTDIVLSDLTFTNAGNSGGNGGSIFVSNINLFISGCNFSENSITDYGGAIYAMVLVILL